MNVQIGDISTKKISKTNKEHILRVTNYKSGEKVTYQIVLLKGYVTNQNCIKSQQNIIVQQEFYSVSPKNTFKALVKLQEGSNIISLNYCCQTINFELIYEVPRNKRRYVTPLYVVFQGHDGSFQTPAGQPNNPPVAIEKLQLNCQLIQTILAEKLYETHQKHLTFHLTEPKIFKSEINIEESHNIDPSELFHKLACEIEKSQYGSPDIKHIAFLSGTQYHGELYKAGMDYQEVIKITQQYIALGRGGLAVFHTACLYTWPERLQDVIKAFLDETPINKQELLDDSNYRGTFGTCYSTTLGSVLHELCHTFNLGHAEVGIMSRGFDDVRDIFLVDSVDAVEADQRRGAHGITDSTALHKSGAQILRYNKWFLPDERDLPFTLTFDSLHNVVQSSWGVRVVEVRSGDEEIMTQNFIYSVAKMNLQLQLSELKTKSKLFIQDSKGHWISQDIN